MEEKITKILKQSSVSMMLQVGPLRDFCELQ